MEWLQDIEVVLFDLDGTLYQDGTFYKRYLELIFEDSEHRGSLEDIHEEMDSMLEGRHSNGIGDWYDPGLCVWRRESVSQPEAGGLHGAEGTNGAIYAGDAWSLASIFAARYGISEPQRQRAFRQVRAEMLLGASSFERHPGLCEAIEKLSGSGVSLRLLTNSPEPAARDFVDALGCGGFFREIVYGAEKPAGLERYMSGLMRLEGLRPGQILSVGDHAWNDLYPVRRLGGRTVWLSAYSSFDKAQWDASLTTLDELAELLIRLYDAKLGKTESIKGGIGHESNS